MSANGQPGQDGLRETMLASQSVGDTGPIRAKVSESLAAGQLLVIARLAPLLKRHLTIGKTPRRFPRRPHFDASADDLPLHWHVEFAAAEYVFGDRFD